VFPRVVILTLFLAACSAPSTDGSTTSPPPPTTTTLSAADIYSLVSPALAFVETPIGSGSAVLISQDTLVTNAHVVWPASRVTVTFPSGLTGEVAVVGYDWMADLALLDVSELSGLPEAAVLATGEHGPGAAVYLIGYPADDQTTASPAITAGIISRNRTWTEAEISFIQSDALISGGQSGGALVDGDGRVLGISGLSVGDGFALALTARDLIARLDSIRSGSDPDSLGLRTPGDLTGPPGNEASIPYVLDETVFVFQGVAGDSVSIEVAGSGVLNADLVGPDGFVETTNTEPAVRFVLEAELVLDGPYFVVVYPESGPIDSVTVSGVDTHLWTDPDHGRTIEVDSRLAGNGDYPGDLDWFRIELEAGETVTISATSINIDASLFVDLLEPGNGSVLVSDSDSGGGVLGYDSLLGFTAPETGTYAIAVFDETGFGPGGYILSVEAGRR
jgi:S1-C subfamily serine protease